MEKNKKMNILLIILLIILIVTAIYFVSTILKDNDSKDDTKQVVEESFRMTIEDVFTITGRGTVATGKIEKGTIHVGDKVKIIGNGKDRKNVKIKGIEVFRKTLESASEGDNVGLALENLNRDDVEIGQVIVK